MLRFENREWSLIFHFALAITRLHSRWFLQWCQNIGVSARNFPLHTVKNIKYKTLMATRTVFQIFVQHDS